jgi:predicted GNAT family acetyltransferase
VVESNTARGVASGGTHDLGGNVASHGARRRHASRGRRAAFTYIISLEHPMSNAVTNNPSEHRYELVAEGNVAFVTYRRDGDTVALLHTRVPPELSGRGIGTQLGLGALDHLRADRLKVDPQCSFIARLIEEHPEYQPMLAR